MRCYARSGYHATTMDDLVRECGLSKGSLYWHFESKLDVFLAFFDAFEEEIFRHWDEAESAAEPVSALALLKQEIASAFESLGGERALVMAWAEFLALPEGRARMARLYATTRQRLADTLRRGIERGELRAVDPESTAAALLAVAEGMALQAMVNPNFDLRAQLSGVWALVDGGISSE
jgi:AcrR family transcriptional regulator